MGSKDPNNNNGPILFEPHKIPSHIFPQYNDLQACVDDIPRFLFRLTGPQSAGTTTTTEVCSRAWLNNASDRTTDLFAYPSSSSSTSSFSSSSSSSSSNFSPSLVAQRLEDHLLSMIKFDSNLVSWTSSLLFALHYAVYRHYLGDRLDHLSLLLVDTTQFPRGAIIRDHLAIKAFASYSAIPADEEGLKILHKWRNGSTAYFGEYLSQGRLPLDPDLCAQVSMTKLHDQGLVRLFPSIWYRDLPATWCGALLALRAELRSASTKMVPADVARAIRLAKTLSCRRFHVPMALMFLSLCPRGIDDDDDDSNVSMLLQEALIESDEFTGHDMVNLEYLRGSQKFNPFSPEIDRYHKLIHLAAKA